MGIRDVSEKSRVFEELRSILAAESDGVDVGHISVFGVVLKMKDDDHGGQSSPVLAARYGARLEDILVCLVLNKEKVLPMLDSDGTQAVKPSRWGMPGGSVDEGEGKDLIGFNNITPEELMDGVEAALKREIREEVGIEVDPCWGLFSIERDEDDLGRMKIVVTVACEIVFDGDTIDNTEIIMREFFPIVRLPLSRVRGVEESFRARGMYTGHQRRLTAVLRQLGPRFSSIFQQRRQSR